MCLQLNVQQHKETNLREIPIPWETEACKVHVRDSLVQVHVHIWNGGGIVAAQRVLPVGERACLVCLTIYL